MLFPLIAINIILFAYRKTRFHILRNVFLYVIICLNDWFTEEKQELNANVNEKASLIQQTTPLLCGGLDEIR